MVGSPEKEEIGGIRGFGCQSVKAALESKQLQNRKLTSEQDIVEPVNTILVFHILTAFDAMTTVFTHLFGIG